MKRFRVLGVLLAMIFAVGALVASGEDSEPKKVDKTEEDSEDAPAEDSEDAPAEEFGVGDTVELGDWQGVIHEFTDPAEAADEFDEPESGKRLVRIEAEVTNISDSSGTVTGDCFELKDSKNRTYNDDLMIDDPDAGYLSGDVGPGDSLRGALFYEVPEDADGLVANFNCDFMSSSAAKIKLS